MRLLTLDERQRITPSAHIERSKAIVLPKDL
jgi:hypothetical protein